jgi:rRNA maturation RNase YbeY
MKSPSSAELRQLGSKFVLKIIRRARKHSALLKRLPGVAWRIELGWVSSPQMKRMNSKFKGKHYATDILSFPAPPVFREQGWLGELVICENVLRRQARQLGHPPETELEVLLVHGLLHLLGFDHERGPKAARIMAIWEAKLSENSGLIARTLSR